MTDPGEERIDWLDQAGRTIRVVSRAEMRRGNLLHRVSETFVFHSDGRLFVQIRAPGKDLLPGWHDLVVGGTVQSGESAAANACREVAEELGVRGVPLFPLFQHRYRDSLTDSLVHAFACTHDGPMVLQPEEVAGGFWVAPGEVERLAERENLCPSGRQAWRLLGEKFGHGRPPAQIAAEHRLEPVDCGV